MTDAAPGQDLLHYRLIEKIGEGGMGVVWKGVDTTLDREVAIKILPPGLADDADRLARFEREAKLLASLNHPGIASIFSVHEADSVHFIAMEMVEGEELADRMARGPIPLEEAMEIARQIAVALETAHDSGIVHRDLKPANVKMTPDGQAKVLDFGLAKALQDPVSSSGSASSSMSPTVTSAGTVAGVILGTAAYMSPEQAKGKPVDRRADIWAFGVMLFEMLTSSRMVAEGTVSEAIAAVLLKDPEWQRLPAGTPRSLERLLRRCLTKDPHERLRDIGEARITLEHLTQQGDDEEVVSVAATAVSKQGVWPAVALLLAGLLLGAGIVWWFSPAAPVAPKTTEPLHLSILPPEEVMDVGNPVMSPDGRFVVYQGRDTTRPLRLYRRDLFTGETLPVPGTKGSSAGFFSPDGRWIGFVARRRMQKVSVDGGDPLEITEMEQNTPGAVWLKDGTILYSPGWLTGLARVSSEGGKPVPVTTPDSSRGEIGHWWPSPLPDGRHVLFTVWPDGAGINDARTAILDLEEGTWTDLMQGARAEFSAPDRLFFYRAGTYQTVRFDHEALRIVGDAVAVSLPIEKQYPHGSQRSPFGVGPDDTLVYVPGTSLHPLRRIVRADRSGNTTPLVDENRAVFSLSLSPDDRQLATSEFQGGRFSLFVYDIQRKVREQLRLEGSNFQPVWMPGGERLSYSVLRRGNFDAYNARPDGSDEQPLATGPRDEEMEDWFSDGVRFLVQTDDRELHVHDIESGEQILLPIDSMKGRVSPDDRWLVYSSVTSGRDEIYVQSMEGGARARVSSEGGYHPLWCPTANELFYLRGKEVVAVSYSVEGNRFRAGKETVLFRSPGLVGTTGSQVWDVTRDCRSFVMLHPGADTPSRPELRVVRGWSKRLQ